MIKLYPEERTNPVLEFDYIWMFHEKSFKGHQLRFPVTGGEIQYKLHIALDYSDYMDRTRDIVATFLSRNNISYKCGGSLGSQQWNDPARTQFGKMFTCYPKDVDEFLKIVKGMRILAPKYSLKGVDITGTPSNLHYEIPVPGTNNTLYYTVEMISTSILMDLATSHEVDSFTGGKLYVYDYRPESSGVKLQEPYFDIKNSYHNRTGPTGFWYLTSSSDEKGYVNYIGKYAGRLTVLKKYWGEGPIDFLWDSPP